MPNLKVNSKSSILEFKRKHNNLVDEMSEDLGKKADKIILDDIKYEFEDNYLRITLPQGVMPLRLYDDNFENFYFNFGDNKVYDIEGNMIDGSGIEFLIQTNQYKITLPQDYEDVSISDMSFINIIGGDDGILNTYKIYYPSSGTKLYQHDIKFLDNTSSNWTLRVITTNEAKITGSSLSNIPYLLCYVYLMNYMGNRYNVSGFSFIGSGYRINYYGTKSDGTDNIFIQKSQDLNQNIVSDTVTPL